MNGTVGLAADHALQGEAAWFWSVGTEHHPAPGKEFFGEHDWDAARNDIIGFGPVKRDAEVGATSPALQAWLGFLHS